MSLYEPADGLLETHVTWEDVEEAMQKSLGTKAKFGEKRTLVNISDMKGYMSRIAMIEPDWIDVEDSEVLPQKFALKILTQMPLVALSKIIQFDGEDGIGEEKLKKLGKLSRVFHNREVETYKLLIKFNHPDIPYTKVYGSKKFDDENDLKGFLIVDFIPNVHSVGMYLSIPADELVSLVRGISTFAALGQSLTPEEKQFAGGQEYLETMFSEVFGTSSLEKQFAKTYAIFSEDRHAQLDELIKVFLVYQSLLKKYTKIHELLGFKLVFNHGDLWQSNMIHSMGEDGKLKLEAMIDWQSTCLMPPGLDGSRLLLGCLSAEDRREKGPELLKLYHKTFTDVHGKEEFTLQELQDSYNLYFPMAAMLIVPGMASLLSNAEVSEEERNHAMSKATAIVEDVFEIHEYNLKRFPDFMKP